MGLLPLQQPVLPTDNFSQWAEKINVILSTLQNTSFAIEENVVNLSSAQTVAGAKTFSNNVTLNGGFSTDGNFILGGTSGLINCTSLTVTSNSVSIVGSNGIDLKSNSNESPVSLKFAASNIPNRLVFNYSGSGEGVLDIANENIIKLSGASPAIVVGETRWNLPTNAPLQPSLLKWEADNNAVSWSTYDDVASDLAEDVATAISTAGLTLSTPLLPIGVTVDIDADALTTWTTLKDDVNFPGWLKCNGATISKITNPEFTELVRLLNSGSSSPTTGILPNAAGKIIKYKADPVTSFILQDGSGIRFSSGVTTLESITLSGGGGTVSLYTNPDHFEYETGLTNGRLKLKNLSASSAANSIAQRTNAGNLVAATPTADEHLTTKSYVDTKVLQGENYGSTTAFPELINGVGYNDTENTFVMVDKFGNGKAYGDVNGVRGQEGNEFATADLLLNSYSPITDSRVNFVKAFAAPSQYFFVGQDGILYGNGNNSLGTMGASSRGNIVGAESNYFYSWTDGTPYATKTGLTVPAMLPNATLWPAYAVTFEYATGPTSSSTTSITNLTVKTKDGYGNSFVSNDGLNGFVQYNNTVTSLPYTRGYFISTGLNSSGQLGRGNVTALTAASGPAIWSPSSCGRSLWNVYGVKDGERFTAVNEEQLRKRFHWFKPNSVTSGGIGLTEWRTQTGLNIGDEFADFSWYIKKVVRTVNAHYVIVGKPGTEVINECWVSGNNIGNFGNGTTSGDSADFVRVCGTPIPLGSGKVVRNGTPTTIFRFSDSTPHGFKDLEVLSLGSTHYYILRGDGLSNSTLSTQFRLFSTGTAAATALLANNSTGAVGITSPQSNNYSHRPALTGVYDIAVGSSGSNDRVLARVATTETPDANALDSLPESAVTTVQLYGWGYNANGGLGVGDSAVTATPKLASVASSIGSAKIMEIVSS